MSSRARGPKTIKGALVSVSPGSSSPKAILFQYNPATLQRNLQPQMVGGEEGDRSQAVRFTGAPTQTVSVKIELDATDQLEQGDTTTVRLGISPQLAALELLAYPDSRQVLNREQLLSTGTIEIESLVAPFILFVWGARRVLPVRLTSYGIEEEAFDANLNPIQATVDLSMRVLNYSDLDSSNREYFQFLTYQQNMEAIFRQAITGVDKSIVGVNTGQVL